MKLWSTHKASARLAAAIVSLLLPAMGGATTIIVPTDDQLIDKSPLIVIGHVDDSVAVDQEGSIRTLTRLSVEQTLKGTAAETLVIRESGGRVGDRLSVVFGSPVYSRNERVLVFLWPTGEGDYQTRDLFIGKFEQRKAADGERIWFRAGDRAGVNLLRETPSFAADMESQRHGSRFEKFITERTAGRRPHPDYFVSKLQLPPSVSPDFTLIDEPTIYRWFTFDTGTVSWRHFGTQSGYTNGGVSELQTAMGAWTGYSGARIRYSYGGVTGTTLGGLERPNGINEVVFEDPLNEIDGSWTGGSGVVGRGGFNGVRTATRSWTSSFTADASHPAQTFAGVWDIAEGNLVIQNGVSPARGISPSTLAEILSHEFGHTLGLGHSADSTALMHASLVGSGPTLRGDDQVAARWLYPGSATTPTLPPLAPSGLSGSGVGTAIQLNWIDNATDETTQTIYLAVPGGSFVVRQTVGANARTATVTGLTAGQSYQIRLTASNSSGESATSNTIQVLVPGDVVRSAFLVSPSSGIANVTTFSFSDRSTGPVATRQWTFGDGSSSSERNSTRLYSTPGTYNVKLRVTDTSGNASESQTTVIVTLSADAVSASFAFSPTSPTSDQAVTFSDQSVGPITQWLWNFGDGTTSIERNPTKRYVSGGVFEVSLTVSNGTSSSTATSGLSVAGGSGAVPSVNAEFELSTLWPAAGSSIRFFDRSFGAPNSWLWSFGDGTTSTQKDPVHSYLTAGIYPVTLRSGNAGSTSTKASSIKVGAPDNRYRSILPVSTLTSGAGSTFWRTELTLANPTSTSLNVDVLFLSSTAETPLRRSVVIGAGQSVTYQNALTDLFGLLTGLGAITIEASSSAGKPVLHVSSRTFTSSPQGTYGQHVPTAATSSPATLFITGLENSANYRTNIGVVNHSTTAASTNVAIYDANGIQLAAVPLTIPAGGFQQTSLPALFPGLFGPPRNALSLRVQSIAANSLTAYASVVDNRSQDPIFVPAVVPPPPGDLIVPGAARIPGASGTFWRTDVTLFNATAGQISMRLRLLGGSRERAISLSSGATTVITDLVDWLGEGDRQGALIITEVVGIAGPIVSTRTYTSRENGGTFGQWIPAIPVSEMGETSFVTGLRGDETYRTNVGFVNPANIASTVRITLLGAATAVANASVIVPPSSSLQVVIGSLFPGVDIRLLGTFSLTARSENTAPFMAYGSVVDNSSGDPVFIRGE